MMEAQEYDRMAQLEDRYWWYQGLRQLICGIVRREFPAGKEIRILDGGCGTGGMLSWLSKDARHGVLVGIDLSSKAVTYATQRKAGVIIRGTVNQLPFKDEVFDAALSLDVFYMKGVEDTRAVQEARRVLKSGGVLVLNLPAFEWLRGEHDRAILTRHRYTLREVQQLLAGHGFTIKRLFYWNFLLLPFVFVTRRFLRRSREVNKTPKSDLMLLPGWLNWLLRKLLVVDIELARRIPVPFGVSILGMGYKI
jgi:ubiquinone/menaquinone biosynthesis C-methylase UbiE